jgi:hypothetical protein
MLERFLASRRQKALQRISDLVAFYFSEFHVPRRAAITRISSILSSRFKNKLNSVEAFDRFGTSITNDVTGQPLRQGVTTLKFS